MLTAILLTQPSHRHVIDATDSTLLVYTSILQVWKAPIMETITEDMTLNIEQGTMLHTVLLYTVSDPGDWTARDIVDDLPGTHPAAVRRAVHSLQTAGLIHENSADQRLWPRREAKALILS